MSFDWLEFLHLARELAGQSTAPSSQDAKLRTAISRAYYASFKRAYLHLRGRDSSIAFVRSDIHTYVIDKFRHSPEVAWRGIGVNLDRLRRSRNRADYEDVIPQLADATTKALMQAEKIISDLAKL